MNLTNYQIINTAANANKFVHTKNSDKSAGTKLVVNSDKDSPNYDFLLFPVDPLRTDDTDFFYMVHTQSGKVLGIEDQSTKKDKKIVLAKITGEADQHWSFNYVDANGNYEIENRNSGKVWRLKSGDTSNGTAIKQANANDENHFYWNFQLAVDPEDPAEFKEIPNPELVGYEKRFTENTINDPSLIPPADKSSATCSDTQPVIIGESSAPYYMIDDDTLRDLPLQVKETPYYVIQRSQYWKFLGNTNIPAGQALTEEYTYTYGASATENEEFTAISDWTLSADLSIAYKSISAGVSGSISESMGIKKGSSSTNYDETTITTKTEYTAEDYERILYYWQIVDVITVLDGTGNIIVSIDIQGIPMETTVYSDTDVNDNTRPSRKNKVETF